MARVSKTIVALGNHQSPEGEVAVTPARIQHWIKQNAEMKRLGIDIPCPWGHQADAVPVSADEKRRLSALFNAGYVDGFGVASDGGLAAEFDCPGLDVDPTGKLTAWVKSADGHQVKTAIKEVSVAIADHFRDGQGRVWDDVITHVALTPLPVWAGQDGFKQLSLSGRAEKLHCLALTPTGWTLATKGSDMADDKEKNKFPPEEPMAPEPEDGETATEPPPPVPPPDAPAATVVEPAAINQQAECAQCLPLLASHGITLPPDTTPENICHHLRIAMTALKGKLVPEGEPDPASTAPVVENTDNQMLMSLIREKPGLGKIVERQRESAKQGNIDKIATLKKRGLSAHYIAELTARADEGVKTLALTSGGDFVEPKQYTLGNMLDTMLLVLPKNLASKAVTKTLSAAQEVPGPSKDDKAALEEQRLTTLQMADMALGRPVRQK